MNIKAYFLKFVKIFFYTSNGFAYCLGNKYETFNLLCTAWLFKPVMAAGAEGIRLNNICKEQN